jgi:hypothetical protein
MICFLNFIENQKELPEFWSFRSKHQMRKKNEKKERWEKKNEKKRHLSVGV